MRANSFTHANRIFRGQSGATLVEALVALLILSFGLLGIAGLMATSLRAANDTGNYIVASNLAREFADRVRANRQIAQLPAGNPYLFDSQVQTPQDPGFNCSTASCSLPQNLARWDIFEWWSRAINGSINNNDANNPAVGLPQLRVVVCYDSTPLGAGSRLQWNCNATPGAPMVMKLGWASRDATGRADSGSGSVFDVQVAPRLAVQALPGPGE
jgi:type IV pilus assembly protein PilV